MKPQSLACDHCKLLVQDIDAFLKANKTEGEVKELLDQFCTFLQGVKDECISAVDYNFPLIWKLLESDFSNSTEICQLFGWCPRMRALLKSPPASKSKDVMTGMKDVLPLTSIKKPQGWACDDCKSLVQDIDAFLKANKTEGEEKELLDQFCTFLGQSKNECLVLVSEFFPIIWKLLESDFSNSTEICQLVGWCPRMRALLKSPPASKCVICKDVMTGLKPLTSKLTVAGLKDACKLLPSDVASECSDIVVEYGPEITKLLADAINPQAICKDITLCS